MTGGSTGPELWGAAGAVLTALATIAKVLGGKVNQVGEHLKAQDGRHLGLVQRMARIEGRLGLPPLREEEERDD